MPISDFHASHIRRVRVAFLLESSELDPHAVSTSLSIAPTRFAAKGDERCNAKGDVVGLHERGWWQLSSEGAVSAKDVNDHFHHLLKQLLPHREAILRFAKGKETYFDVLWESTYLYAGTGPLLSAESISGAASLGASMGFDIYQIDEAAV